MQYKYTIKFLGRTVNALGLESTQNSSFISNDSEPKSDIRDTDGFLSIYDHYEHIDMISITSIEAI